jgi:hypothetical protein
LRPALVRYKPLLNPTAHPVLCPLPALRLPLVRFMNG